MEQVTGRSFEGKLKEHNYPLIAVIVSSVILALCVLTMVVAVLAAQPL